MSGIVGLKAFGSLTMQQLHCCINASKLWFRMSAGILKYLPEGIAVDWSMHYEWHRVAPLWETIAPNDNLKTRTIQSMAVLCNRAQHISRTHYRADNPTLFSAHDCVLIVLVALSRPFFAWTLPAIGLAAVHLWTIYSNSIHCTQWSLDFRWTTTDLWSSARCTFVRLLRHIYRLGHHRPNRIFSHNRASYDNIFPINGQLLVSTSVPSIANISEIRPYRQCIDHRQCNVDKVRVNACRAVRLVSLWPKSSERACSNGISWNSNRRCVRLVPVRSWCTHRRWELQWLRWDFRDSLQVNETMANGEFVRFQCAIVFRMRWTSFRWFSLNGRMLVHRYRKRVLVSNALACIFAVLEEIHLTSNRSRWTHWPNSWIFWPIHGTMCTAIGLYLPKYDWDSPRAIQMKTRAIWFVWFRWMIMFGKLMLLSLQRPKSERTASPGNGCWSSGGEMFFFIARAVAVSNRYTCLRIVIRSTITAGLNSSKFGMIMQIFGLTDSWPGYLWAYHDRSTFIVYWARRNLMTGSSASVSMSLSSSESSPRKLRLSLAWRKRINISIDFIWLIGNGLIYLFIDTIIIGLTFVESTRNQHFNRRLDIRTISCR